MLLPWRSLRDAGHEVLLHWQLSDAGGGSGTATPDARHRAEPRLPTGAAWL